MCEEFLLIVVPFLFLMCHVSGRLLIIAANSTSFMVSMSLVRVFAICGCGVACASDVWFRFLGFVYVPPPGTAFV